jgi:hypothetical protein
MLLVEVEGEEYPTSRTGGPLLPAFKTEEFTWDTISEISRFLAEDECSLTTGPVFNDYHSGEKASRVATDNTPEPQENPKEKVAESDMRLWATADGRTMEAEFITAMGGNVILKTGKRKQVKMPLETLSEADRLYISLAVPPKLDINFLKTTKPRKFGATMEGKAPPVVGSFYTFAARIKQTSTRPYGHPLTAEFFAIGDEIGGQKKMLLDYQRAEFTLSEESDYSFEFKGPPVELLDYTVNNERRGKRYGGYLVVIKDSRGEIIAYETPSEKLYKNLENLRKIHVGWYFDKECNRCLPTPPDPWVEPSGTN